MKITVYPKPISGIVEAPGSKSVTHRAIILAALSKTPVKIHNPLISDDTICTLKAFESIGYNIRYENNTLTIQKPTEIHIPSSSIECLGSGTTLRLLLPIFGLIFNGVTFHGEKRLMDRIELTDISCLKLDYIRTFQSISIFNYKFQKFMELNDNLTSQYISGLLLASPLYPEDFTLVIKNTSGYLNPYISLTIKMLEKFGIKSFVEINDTLQKITIRKNQQICIREFSITGDYSAAANLLALGALGGKVIIKNLNKTSSQADFKIIEFLKKMNAQILIGKDTVTIKESILKATDIDISNCPDLGPIMIALLSLAKGTSSLTGYEKLELKESNRITSTITNLAKLGANIQIDEENKVIIIEGVEKFNGSETLESFNDHRIVLMLLAISPKLMSRISIENAEAISKSYPKFLNDFKKLGGSYFEK